MIRALTDKDSLLPALLLGTGAGIVGATLGWFLMAGLHLTSETQPAPTPTIERAVSR